MQQSLLDLLLFLYLPSTTLAFLPPQPQNVVVVTPHGNRCTEFRVARAETRTTVSTLQLDDNDNDAATFRKLCQLVCPDQSRLVKLHASDDGVRGVFATQKIASGDVVLSVPLEQCLRDDVIPYWMVQDESSDQDATMEINNDSSYEAGTSSWAKRLAASLIELQLDAMEKSFVDETSELWLSLLPEPSQLRASLPVHWSEEVVESAHCAALELAVDSAYFARAHSVDDLLLQLLERCKVAKVWNPGHLRILIENALDVVQTRTCRVETIADDNGNPLRLLAPLFDMMNHRHDPNAGFGLEHLESKDGEAYDALVIRATQDIAANAEVFISYGASTKPSWRCLASYGFVPTYDPSEPEYEDEESEEMPHSAELFVEGRRYEVGPGSIPQELVDTMQDCVDPTLPKPAMLTPQVALRLAQRISEAAFQMLLDDSGTDSLDSLVHEMDDETDPDDTVVETDAWSLAQVVSARQAASLRWNQHRILMSCSLGLRDWVAGQSAGSNISEGP